MISGNNKLSILLCVRNGSKYLEEQLNSYKAQTYPDWSIWVSDDGSTDGSCQIISDFISELKCTSRLLSGPQLGFGENFMSLVCNPDIQSDYYAFSDQDDIWAKDKLERAVDWLDTIDTDIPALFCSRTFLIDSCGKNLGLSPKYIKSPGFGNAIVQNIASGNTMVFNNRARELLKKVNGLPIVAHDWTLYQVVTGCGGEIFFDNNPTVFYRQHNLNVIGDNSGIFERFNNFIKAYRGRRVEWDDRNFKVLSCIESDLTSEAKNILSFYKNIRGSSLINRVKFLKKSKVYHQKGIGRLVLLIYAIFNKL